jgi:hypothetical protein
MEIKINLEVSLSAETINVLSSLVGSTEKVEKVATPEPVESVKPKKEKAVKSEVTKAAENGQGKEPAVTLSDIRQYAVKSEGNKALCRKLCEEYGAANLAALPAENYAEFYEKLKAGEEV